MVEPIFTISRVHVGERLMLPLPKIGMVEPIPKGAGVQ
jgi:hypothetical protein